MRNKVKRTLSFLLTFVMLCSLLPAMALAKEPEGRYEEVAGVEALVEDAEVHVYSTKGAGTIELTGINAVETTFPRGTGYRQYTATANEGWVFDTWRFEQLYKGEDLGNRHDYGWGKRYSFTNSGDDWKDPYTEGNATISVNRLLTAGETVFNKLSYKVYADFNPTITATAGENGTIFNGEKPVDAKEPVEVEYGKDQTFEIKANDGYVIDTIKVDGNVVEENVNKVSDTYTFENVAEPHNIDVTFRKTEVGECTVTYEVFGEFPADYVIPESVTVNEGDIYTVADVPPNVTTDEGTYTFKGWYNGEIKVGDTIEVTSDVTLTGTWTFDGKDDVWNAVYGSIRVYMDEGTKADFDKLQGSEDSKQVRLYSEEYPIVDVDGNRYRLCVPSDDYWGTTNIAERVTANDISEIVLAKDKAIGSSEKINIPMTGNEQYTVAVTEDTDKLFGLIPYTYLKISITKNDDPVDPTTPVEDLPVFLYVLNQTDGETTDDPADYSYLATGAKVKAGTSMETPYTGKEAQNQIASWNVGKLGNHDGYAEVSSTPVGAESKWEMDENGNVTEFSFQIGDKTYTNADYDFTWQKLSYIDASYKENKDDTEWKPAFHLDGVLKKKPEVRTVEVKFVVDIQKGEFTEYGVGPVVFNIKENSSEKYLIPQITPNDGYEFTGWKILGNAEVSDGSLPKEMTEFELANVNKQIQYNGNEGSVTIEAMFSKKPVEKTLRIHWAIDNPEGAAWKLYEGNARTETIAWADRGNTFVMPELEIKDGYKLAGWSVSGTEGQYWDPETYEFGLTGLIVEDENGGQVSITANVVKDEEPAGKTLRIHWAIDNPEGAAWKLYEGNARTETIAWADRGNTFVMPELEIKDGYKLAGWSVSGTEGQYWDPETYEFGLTGLIVEDENGGQVSITANVIKDEVSTEDKIANVYFTVNPKYGYFKEYGEGPVSFENIDADSTQQFEVPEVVAKSGYKFVGWEGKGAGEIKWDANASTFGVPGLCYFPEGSNVGRADIRAVFEKEGGGHINDYAVTVIVDGKGEVKTKDYGTVGSNDTDVIWIPDFEDSVKFTMEPADGWKIDDVLVNGKSIGAEDSYVFETEDLMDSPELKVIFEKKSSGGGGGGSHDKDDDKDKDKAPDKTPDALNGEDHFNYIVGDADGKVHPERNITRAEVASIFFRLLQDDVREKNLTDQNPFNDVFTDDWFNVAVSTMYDMDIVYGRDNNNFDPNAYITRAEFAAIAARFDSEGYSGENLFTDIDGHWAANQINRAAEKGWISGYPDGTFGPDRYITRAEAVTMINRVLNRLPESADALHEDMNVFPDNMDTTAWYYLAIQEATSSHEYEKDKDGVYETWTDVLPDRDWAQYLKLN